MFDLPLIDYDNLTLNDVFDGDDEFLADFKTSAFYNKLGFDMTDDSLLLTFALVYARYGANPIANKSKDLFKLKFYGIIWQYGPKWVKDVAIQTKLRSLSLESGSVIYQGSKAIYNHAAHDSTAPATSTLDEITYIDEQNTTNYKKSTLEGLASLYELLRTDVTETYINQFRKLFSKFVSPDKHGMFYEVEEDEQ